MEKIVNDISTHKNTMHHPAGTKSRKIIIFMSLYLISLLCDVW